MIAEKRNGSRRFHAHDSLGSTIALVSDSSKETDTYTYWPYGEIRTSTGSTASTPFKFCGAWGYYDDGNQLYVRARYLRSQLGRWITRDPLWPTKVAYIYFFSNPVSFLTVSKHVALRQPNQIYLEYELFRKACFTRVHFSCNESCRQITGKEFPCCNSARILLEGTKWNICCQRVCEEIKCFGTNKCIPRHSCQSGIRSRGTTVFLGSICLPSGLCDYTVVV